MLISLSLQSVTIYFSSLLIVTIIIDFLKKNDTLSGRFFAS